MIFSEIFERFVKGSPITVMTRAMFENVLSKDVVERLFETNAETQYTRNLLFSTIADLMALVVCRSRPSINAAYQSQKDKIGVSVQSVYNKLDGIEPIISQVYVRHVGPHTSAIVRQMGGERPALLPGYRVKILDGNHFAATERRLEVLRNKAGGPLPGFGLAVLDPALELMIDFFPCEDGHASERSLTAAVLATVAPKDVWVDDRNFSTSALLFGIAQRDGYFVTRHHASNPAWKPAGERRRVETDDDSEIWEQPVLLEDNMGNLLPSRRITVKLKKATRDGDAELHILTNLPEEVSAEKVARLYRKRWSIETAFQELERNLDGEINTLGYPKAALFAFSTALVAYNLYSAVNAALRAAHGAEKIDKEVSDYYIAVEVAAVREGMMLAIPEIDWNQLSNASIPMIAEFLIGVARKVNLATLKRHPRGPKKPRPKRVRDNKHNHVSTAKLLAKKKAKKKAPKAP